MREILEEFEYWFDLEEEQKKFIVEKFIQVKEEGFELGVKSVESKCPACGVEMKSTILSNKLKDK